MIHNYFKIAWRNFYKRKFYTTINVLGLALGISCTLVLYIFISYHNSFDKFHTNNNRIYRTVTDLHLPDGSIEYDQGSPLILGQTIKQQLPSIENETVLLDKRTFTISIPQNNHKEEKIFHEIENVAFTDNNWFKIFNYNWEVGTADSQLRDPFTAVITADVAKKYFDTKNAVGKNIVLDDKFNVTITGVLKENPDNSDFQSKIFLSVASIKPMYPDIVDILNHNWTFISSKNHVFVLLKKEKGTNLVNGDIASIAKKAFNGDGNTYQFHLQPLSEVHFDGRYSGSVSKPFLITLGIVGLALILIASVNFINMSTAQSLTRAKEIGTRKVLGSGRKEIFWQFMTETSYVVFAAAIIAFTAIFLFLPVFDNWLLLPLEVNLSAIVFTLLLLLLITFIAGFYPGIVLSRFKPIAAIKNKVTDGKFSSRFSRSLLIIIQNSIAQILIVCSLIIALQVSFFKKANLGFQKQAIIMVPIPKNSGATISFFRDQLNGLSGVKNVSFCFRPPASNTVKAGTIRYDGRNWEKFPVSSIVGDENYLKTFELQLLAGRNLNTNDTAGFLINQQVLYKLGIKNAEQAIGHKLTAGDLNNEIGTIVGVVKDFHSHSLYTPIEPALITSNINMYEYAAIKIADSRQHEIISEIQQKWQGLYPKDVFEYSFLDQQLADFYKKDEMINKLIKASTCVAIFISCLGLLGLISLAVIQRTKEIAIRKVLGAPIISLIVLLTKDFIKLIFISILISTPIAWLMMHDWLQSYAYRTEIKWWLFGISALIAIVIACFTISLQAVKAALANPVKNLRD